MGENEAMIDAAMNEFRVQERKMVEAVVEAALAAVMDDRVEDVARTIHALETARPEDYWGEDYPWTWENENGGHVKSVRRRARELIEKMDARASRTPAEESFPSPVT